MRNYINKNRNFRVQLFYVILGINGGFDLNGNFSNGNANGKNFWVKIYVETNIRTKILNVTDRLIKILFILQKVLMVVFLLELVVTTAKVVKMVRVFIM